MSNCKYYYVYQMNPHGIIKPKFYRDDSISDKIGNDFVQSLTS